MSAAVMSPTPALPANTRRPSVWEKMASPFKSSSKKAEVVQAAQPTPAQVEAPAFVAGDNMFAGFSLSNKKQEGAEVDDSNQSPDDTRPRKMSVVPSIATPVRPANPRSPSSQNRAASLATPSVTSRKSSFSRAASFSSTLTRRGSKWWSSSNEDDSTPPVPAIDAKFKLFGSSANPDVNPPPVPSPPQSRRPSYVPRNAAGSFLKTTTQKPRKPDLEEVNRQLSVSGASRKASIISDNGVLHSGRRASSVSDNGVLPAGRKLSIASDGKSDQPKLLEVRKDSHFGAEKSGMFSMAGICDIIEDANEEQAPEVVNKPATSEKKGESIATVQEVAARTDSAKGSPEMLATKTDAQREPSLIEGTAV